MDNSAAPQNGQASLPPQQQASLIRFEQVRKLPHLNEQQKQHQEVVIQKLWETINSQPPNSAESQKSYARLGQISATLMNGMRQYQAMRKQQQNTAQATQPNGANTTTQSGTNAINFNQLNAAIQARVNSYTFVYPPAMIEGTRPAEDWLREAKARFGQALQRSEVAKNKKMELQRTLQQRQGAGNPLDPQEMELYNTKMTTFSKALVESNAFMEKFKQQQQDFKNAAQPQQRYPNQSQPVPAEGGDQPAMSNIQPTNPTPQGPTAHSISSAVSAARNQANAAQQAQAVSPPNVQAQAQSAQTPNAVTATPGPQHQLPNVIPSPYNAQHTQNDMPSSTTSQHAPQLTGPPRSLSQSAAMSQSGQTYAAQAQQQQPPSTTHAHPPQGYLNPTKKDDRQPITKNLQVTTPKSIAVPPARPTLNGGPGVGMPGQMGQPAIPSMPGYVLETSEDGRVLSKKKLNELVKEVCGPGGDEQLTPEVEEIFLQIADDFVDDLITAACRLSKLRNSSTLEIRDLQLVLERQYNIRVPGFSSDEIRTVRRIQPATGWAQKMSAVQAAKLTGGGTTATTSNSAAGPGASASAANGVRDS